jgi:FdhD protein
VIAARAVGLIDECPVAIEVGGVSLAVMLATPADLEDFAFGFLLAEGFVADAREVLEVEAAPAAGAEGAVVVRVAVTARAAAGLAARRRTLAGRTGCGLCGAESLAQLAPPPPRRPVAAARAAAFGWSAAALARALRELPPRQPLQARTGGAHAAAWCGAAGEVRLVREDVGRHNALDKLIGALHREGVVGAPRGAGGAGGSPAAPAGFVLMTSRASVELVQKAARSGLPALAAMSAATAQSVQAAQAAGVALAAFVREGRHTVLVGADAPPPVAAAATIEGAA